MLGYIIIKGNVFILVLVTPISKKKMTNEKQLSFEWSAILLLSWKFNQQKTNGNLTVAEY